MQEVQQVPIKYVGQRPAWTDDLYGSLVEFTRGKVSMVPGWAAAKLLRHKDLFADARKPGERDQPISEFKPVDLAQLECEMQELDEMDAHVPLHNMTNEQLGQFAMRTFGVRVDTHAAKQVVTERVRDLMRARRA